jgi:hypothetical protein
MTSRIIPHVLVWVWLAVLASPIAWAASLVSMFWLTHPVCQGLSRSVLTLAGVGCALVAVGGALSARSALRRASACSAESSDDVCVFLLRLALWSSLIFALVIGLSLVPTALLTPCPVKR